MDSVRKRLRRSVRLAEYDYSRPGAYFVSVCTVGRACCLGEINGGRMTASAEGQIVTSCWLALPAHFPFVSLDAFVVMPNPIHGIVVIGENGAVSRRGMACHAPTALPRTFGRPQAASLASIVGSFKSASTRQINTQHGTPGSPIWQRNYHEHVVRNDQDMTRIRLYIVNNSARWLEDEYFPESAP